MQFTFTKLFAVTAAAAAVAAMPASETEAVGYPDPLIRIPC